MIKIKTTQLELGVITIPKDAFEFKLHPCSYTYMRSDGLEREIDLDEEYQLLCFYNDLTPEKAELITGPSYLYSTDISGAWEGQVYSCDEDEETIGLTAKESVKKLLTLNNISFNNKIIFLYKMNNTKEFVEKKLLSYFPCKIIGSALLKNLDYVLLNDIDILTHCVNSNRIRAFLLDIGFKETQSPIESRGYDRIEGSLTFLHNEYDKPIHVNCYDKVEIVIYNEEQIIAEKFKRGKITDLLQIKNIINNRLKLCEKK